MSTKTKLDFTRSPARQRREALRRYDRAMMTLRVAGVAGGVALALWAGQGMAW